MGRRNYIAHRLPSAKTCHSPFSPFYLGNFSPLNDLNTLYRGWMGCVRGSTYLEESDSNALAGDRFSNVLALVLERFLTFRNSSVGVGDLLRPNKEDVLTEVAIQLESCFCVQSTQGHLLLPNIRTAREIPRTGHDSLISKLNESNWLFALSPV